MMQVISIDLSSYVLNTNFDTSFINIHTTLNTIHNKLTLTTPLNKDVSNDVTIDLSPYVFKTNSDTSFNNIHTALSTKTS